MPVVSVTYATDMTTDESGELVVPVGEARERLRDLIDHSRRRREPVHLSRRGKPYAVLVDADVWAVVVGHAEDALDHEAVAEARAEDDGGRIPWGEVKRDLGLDDERPAPAAP